LCSQSASFNIRVEPEPSLYESSPSLLAKRFAHLTPLPLSWETHMDSELDWSFQPSFEMRATFTSFIFLNPKPPVALGTQKESQDLRDRYLALE
jgi:hypothetical protein